MNKYVVRIFIGADEENKSVYINFMDLNENDVLKLEKEEYTCDSIKITRVFDTAQQAIKFSEKYKAYLEEQNRIKLKEIEYSKEIERKRQELKDKIKEEILNYESNKRLESMIKIPINLVECTKEQFDEFIENYPGKLDGESIYFCTPPVHQYTDSRIANSNDLDSVYRSVVAGYKEAYDERYEPVYKI